MATTEPATAEPPRHDAGDPFHPTRATALAVVVAAVAVTAVVLLAVAVRAGAIGLAGTGEVTTAMARLAALAVLSGVLACAVTEFGKRLTRLRELFNRRAVRRYFAADYVVIDPSVESSPDTGPGRAGTGQDPGFDLPAAVARGLDDLRARQKTSAAYGPDNLPLELAVPPAPPDYSAPLRLLTAQLSPHMEYAARLLATGIISDKVEGPPALVHSRLVGLLTGRPDAVLLSALRDGDRAGSEQTEELAAQITIRGEQRLDSFQIQATTQWRRLLRWVSAGVAAGIVLAAAIASDSRLLTWPVALTLGFVLGGPFAWLTRDLIRVVERKAVSG